MHQPQDKTLSVAPCSHLVNHADRTDGRAYATRLRPSSSVCLSVTLCIVAKRCVLEQKLLLRAYRKSYEKSIGTKLNDLDLCLEVVSRSRQPLRYIWRWISRKPLEIEVWFQRTTNRKWHMGYRMVTWPMTLCVTWPWKVKLVTPICLERNILKTTWARKFKFGVLLYMGNAERAHK